MDVVAEGVMDHYGLDLITIFNMAIDLVFYGVSRNSKKIWIFCIFQRQPLATGDQVLT